MQLLAGKRSITVEVPGAQGDRPLQTFHVDVIAGKTITLSLESPTAVASEGTPTASRRAAAASHGAPALARREPTASHAEAAAAAASAVPPRDGTTTGSLSVSSSPPGATVELDGRKVGTTPLHLTGVTAGSHRLRLVHTYFLPAVETTRVVPGHLDAVRIVLPVNHADPAIAARLTGPFGVGASSLLWSAAQAARIAGMISVTATPGTTASFLTPTTASNASGLPLPALLDLDFNLFITRTGNRLADNSTLTTVNDAFAATAATVVTTATIISENASSPQVRTTWNNVAKYAAAGIVVGMLFDAVSSPISARVSNNDFLAYVAKHGSLPPAKRRADGRPHNIIIESGGDAVARLGVREPIVPNYLAFEETIGLAAKTLTPFAPALTASADLSYDPWGATTGHLRPEVFVGLRASTDFSSSGSSMKPEFGTGNAWVGKYFDIFTRGGLAYDAGTNRWDEFFSAGTRIF